MNLLKSMKDMGAMMNAAPDLFESANRLAENAKVQQAQAMAPAAVVEPSAEALAPIAGVDLAVYARVSKGIAAYGYDASKLPLVAVRRMPSRGTPPTSTPITTIAPMASPVMSFHRRLEASRRRNSATSARETAPSSARVSGSGLMSPPPRRPA